MKTKKLSFGEAIISCFKKFAVFRGRARCSEVGYFSLFYLVSSFMYVLIWQIPGIGEAIIGLIVAVCFFILVVPFISVLVRRLHDTGHSGWCLLLSFLPVVNFLLLYWLNQDSDKQENCYGKSPKYVDSTEGTFRTEMQDESYPND